MGSMCRPLHGRDAPFRPVDPYYDGPGLLVTSTVLHSRLCPITFCTALRWSTCSDGSPPKSSSCGRARP
jgi:hypothetical protein